MVVLVSRVTSKCLETYWRQIIIIMCRIIEQDLEVPKTITHWILREDLQKRKICVCFFLNSLVVEQCNQHVASFPDIFEMFKTDPNFQQKNYYKSWKMVFHLWLKLNIRWYARNTVFRNRESRRSWVFFSNSRGVIY